MSAEIKYCTCNHEGQDKLHGKNKRVCNQLKTNPGQSKKYRCTVCGSIH